MHLPLASCLTNSERKEVIDIPSLASRRRSAHKRAKGRGPARGGEGGGEGRRDRGVGERDQNGAKIMLPTARGKKKSKKEMRIWDSNPGGLDVDCWLLINRLIKTRNDNHYINSQVHVSTLQLSTMYL